MRLFAGTSGYSYKEWKGPFYPERLPAKDMLRFYAEKLAAVEINNTFYRLPRRSVLEGWREQVPEGFRFAIKASRRITHFKRLKDVADETGYLLETTAVLGERLGTLLFQLPPNLPADLERLDRFLELLPPQTRAAFEFRHPSWLDEGAAERLAARGCAVVGVDDESDAAASVPSTAAFGYFRLRRPGYGAAELEAWAEQILARSLDEAFVFFKHEDAGAGPRLAGEFSETVTKLAARKRPRRVGARERQREAG